MVSLDKILKKGRALFLAYDHGFEHGPVEFSGFEESDLPAEALRRHSFEASVTSAKAGDPSYILDIAHKGGYTAVVFQKGLAEKYYDVWGADERGEVPLIIKLNGKTNIPNIEPYSPQNCTVPEALKLGASAVGYTVYVGSEKEAEMIKEFSAIVREAHEAGIPAIGWMYPRGKWVIQKYEKDTNPEVVAYAARVAQELGADIAKVKYTGDTASYQEVVKAAGRTKVVLSGGEKTERVEEFLETVQSVMSAGALGVAVGRNVWKSANPLEVTEKIKGIIFG